MRYIRKGKLLRGQNHGARKKRDKSGVTRRNCHGSLVTRDSCGACFRFFAVIVVCRRNIPTRPQGPLLPHSARAALLDNYSQKCAHPPIWCQGPVIALDSIVEVTRTFLTERQLSSSKKKPKAEPQGDAKVVVSTEFRMRRPRFIGRGTNAVSQHRIPRRRQGRD